MTGWKENAKEAVLLALLVPVMMAAFIVSIPPMAMAVALWWWRDKR